MINLKDQTHYNFLKALTLTFGVLAVFAGCAKDGSFQTLDGNNSASSTLPSPSPSPTPNPNPNPGGSSGGSTSSYKAEPLAWESSSHPERAQWSAAAMKIVTQYFDQLDPAKDVTSFCSPYRSLSKDQKINLWADIFAATAYYECAWDPRSSSVDVGTSNNRDTWSVGLLQLSVVDQANYGFKFGYNFADLQDAEPNLQLGIAIMAKQIAKKGVIMIPTGGSGLYWATLHPGGRYDASVGIQKMTKKLSFCK